MCETSSFQVFCGMGTKRINAAGLDEEHSIESSACLARLEFLCYFRVRFVDLEQSQQRGGYLASGMLV